MDVYPYVKKKKVLELRKQLLNKYVLTHAHSKLSTHISASKDFFLCSTDRKLTGNSDLHDLLMVNLHEHL